jgi:hypothetical protein
MKKEGANLTLVVGKNNKKKNEEKQVGFGRC